MCVLDCHKITVLKVGSIRSQFYEAKDFYGRNELKTQRNTFDKWFQEETEEDLKFKVTDWSLRIWKPGCKSQEDFPKAVRISYEVLVH